MSFEDSDIIGCKGWARIGENMGITEGARPQGRGERMRSRRDWREQLCTVQEALTEDERTEGEGGMAGDGGCRWEPKDIPTKAWGS